VPLDSTTWTAQLWFVLQYKILSLRCDYHTLCGIEQRKNWPRQLEWNKYGCECRFNRISSASNSCLYLHNILNAFLYLKNNGDLYHFCIKPLYALPLCVPFTIIIAIITVSVNLLTSECVQPLGCNVTSASKAYTAQKCIQRSVTDFYSGNTCCISLHTHTHTHTHTYDISHTD
jgi:hypothetical protein